MSHAWIKRIRKGDVLKTPNGVLRVVRDVTHSGPAITKTNVTFAIRHCSWTGRPYTVLNGNDLRYFGYTPTKARVSLRKKIDRAIEHNFAGRKELFQGKLKSYPVLPDFAFPHGFETTCCDVVGIVS